MANKSVLGLFIDEHLSWKSHLSHVNSKMSRSLFAIKQVKHFLPTDSLRTLYFALIHPHISYGILAWGNANQTTLHKTTLLQKRAVRTINNAAFKSHTDPWFNKSKILKISGQYQYDVSLFMYDFTNNRLPISFKDTFKYNHEIQTTRQTRQSHLLHTGGSHSKFASHLPLYNFPYIWNKRTGDLVTKLEGHKN